LQQLLSKEPAMSYRKIAAQNKVTTGYVSRILRLNQVAPDIIKAIMEGKQSRELKIQDFMNKPIPDLWGEQRGILEFSAY
jgi:site-specific DNA recombinase